MIENFVFATLNLFGTGVYAQKLIVWIHTDMTDKTGLRELIRNERRIEFCFEGHSLWDIRRWGLTNVMKEPAKGINITADQSIMTVLNVENRYYQPYHKFGSIHYEEILKYNLIQNEGYY